MKRPLQRESMSSHLFGLTDRNAEVRVGWRWVLMGILWFVLSGFAMTVSVLSLPERNNNILLIVGMLSLMRYVPLLAVVYILAQRMAARYLDDIYELDNEELASIFLEQVVFGSGKEKIIINEGKITEKDERSSLILIGGPGSVQVNLDSVALVEKVNGEPKVIYPRSEPWKLGRFERIREIGMHDEVGKREYAIINSRDQFVKGLSVKSRTKDGIPIEAQGIKVIFSILRRQQRENDKIQDIPDESAVQALVYNQTIFTPESSDSGISFPWDTTVIPLIRSELEELITSRSLSEILTTISQVEVDHASSNEQTNAQLRVDITGRQTRMDGTAAKTETSVPKFESRTKITEQFFEKKFKDKAAKLGVSIEWIDIGIWQLPSSLILEKHKEAWELSQKNAKRRFSVDRSKKRHEMEEVINIVSNVIVANYESGTTSFGTFFQEEEIANKEKEDEIETLEEALFAIRPELKSHLAQREAHKKDSATIAADMLNAFRKELRAARDSIENDGRSKAEKQDELAQIDKALHDIAYVLPHWVNKSP